jgi:hypothetical protein
MALLFEDPAPVALTRYWTMGRSYNGLIGGEILLTHDYRDAGGLLLDLALFRLVVPPLQSEVVGPYLVRGE